MEREAGIRNNFLGMINFHIIRVHSRTVKREGSTASTSSLDSLAEGGTGGGDSCGRGIGGGGGRKVLTSSCNDVRESGNICLIIPYTLIRTRFVMSLSVTAGHTSDFCIMVIASRHITEKTANLKRFFTWPNFSELSVAVLYS